MSTSKNLVIVESPAKAKTIGKYLGSDFSVVSSYGHIRDLAIEKGKKGIGIDIDNGFAPAYEIPEDKKRVVSELRTRVRDAETVWLASDEDREGEAIAWHLFDTLGLTEENSRRIAFHEITKPAILEAISRPRGIDMDLVYAQQARRVLDRIVGFELSPVLWKKIRSGLSAGRVQSVALRLIVDREREINAFVPSRFFKIQGTFTPEGGETTLKTVLDSKFDDQESVKDFLERCRRSDFAISSIDSKESTRTPAPPFTTSSLQQEASRKLGFSVKQTMSVAQKLYENGLITYMRTDSTNLSSLAVNTARAKITALYGERYSRPRQYKTKVKGAQEAHEAIRPTFIDNETIEGTAQEQKLYNLIWKRTIACQMADASVEKTEIKISGSLIDEKFEAQAENIIFDGFLKVYLEGRDDEPQEDGLLVSIPDLGCGQTMLRDVITATESYTTHAPRYTEASLVKKMEEKEIGRPSTYAPTITTLFERQYITKGNREGENRTVCEYTLKGDSVTSRQVRACFGAEKGKLIPEDIGTLVTDYLIKCFPEIVNYDFTARMEDNLDVVAEGKMQWNALISDFYGPFHRMVDDASGSREPFTKARTLGTDPASGKEVIAKMGPYGPFVQIGSATDPSRKHASLRKGQHIEDVTLEEALKLFDLPRELGASEDGPVSVNVGRFGPYVKVGSKFISLPKDYDPYTITLEQAVELIGMEARAAAQSLIREFPEQGIQVLKGKFGPYIKKDRKNYKIPRGVKPEDLDLEKCISIIQAAPEPAASARGKGRRK